MGVLSAVLLTSVTYMKYKYQDAKRLKDMETISGAVEQYYRDNGHYPITNCSMGFSYTGYQGSWSTKTICSTVGGIGINTLANELISYIPVPLKDPSPITIADAGYLYRSDDGKDYCILIHRTPKNMKNFKPSQIDFGRCGSISSTGSCTIPNGNNIYMNTRVGTTGC